MLSRCVQSRIMCIMCAQPFLCNSQTDNYSHSLWYFIKLRHNRFFLFWGCHPLQLLIFTRWPCFVPDTFVPQQPLCKHTHQTGWFVVCVLCVCWTEVNLLVHPCVCFFKKISFCWLVCAAEVTAENLSQSNIYPEPSSQAQGDSIHSPTRARSHGTRPAKTCSQRICETELLPYKINTRRSMGKLCSERHVYV